MGPENTEKITKLSDTTDLMNSEDYRERFQGEYYQLKIRTNGLKRMLENWDAGTLEFMPTCPRGIYTLQLRAMEDYLTILEARAVMEGFDLSIF